MTRYYVDKSDPDLGSYEIESGPIGYRWVWTEIALQKRYEDFGGWRRTEADAYRDAAYDWDSNGAGGVLAGHLRAAATRMER